MLCDSATAVASAMTSRLNSDSSMPGSPCVTPSHIAGTPPANCAVAPASRAARLMIAGKRSNGWCADSMSLYDETIAMFGALVLAQDDLVAGRRGGETVGEVRARGPGGTGPLPRRLFEPGQVGCPRRLAALADAVGDRRKHWMKAHRNLLRG